MVGKNSKLIQKGKMYFGDSVAIGAYSRLDALSKCGIVLGDRVSFGDYSRLLCTGSLNYIGHGITIGNDSHFSEFCFMGAAGGIDIGNNVIAGQCVRFHSENHVFCDPDTLIRKQGVTHKGIRIGNNCWIGAGVVFWMVRASVMDV